MQINFSWLGREQRTDALLQSLDEVGAGVAARASDNDRDLDHVINLDRSNQDARPDGGQVANDIFSPFP